MTITLPAILNHVPKGTRIFKPYTGDGTLRPIAVTDDEASPRSRTLGVREVCMVAGSATPFHMHAQKEKVYIHQWGDVTVLMEMNGEIVSRNPQQQGPIIVPAGVPHALLCPVNAIGDVGHVYVVTSDQEGADIYWEPDEALVHTDMAT